jgi:glucan phosphoethanolaminetransferase (alkaline phosphatase superfamily)
MLENEDEASNTLFTPKLYALAELGVGILIAIFGAYIGYPHFFEVWLVGVVMLLLVFTVLLYLAATVKTREWLKDNNSLPVNVIFTTPIIALWVGYHLGYISQAVVVILFGFLFTLPAAWHYRIAKQES